MVKKIRSENDIEKLSNQQMILLTFLVAIVAAITSAIVVIRFYERNPNIITKIVNNEEVVQRVIEKTSLVDLGKTVIIKESDLIAKAVSDNSKFLFDVVIKTKNESKIISSGFKKDGKIFTQKFDVPEGARVFIELVEIEKEFDNGDISIFKEKKGGVLPEIISEVGNMKLESTVINMFSKNYVEKTFIIKKITDKIFLLDSNKYSVTKNIALGVGISGKVFGVVSGKNIYSFDYFKKG